MHLGKILRRDLFTEKTINNTTFIAGNFHSSKGKTEMAGHIVRMGLSSSEKKHIIASPVMEHTWR